MLELHPYQRRAVEFCLRRLYIQKELGAGLLLSPGLGKSAITIEVLKTLFAFGEVSKVLIIAPLRVVENVWPAELKKWNSPQSYSILHGNIGKTLAQDCQIEIINPEGLAKISELGSRYDMAVVDESTKFKSWTAKRTKYLRKMLKEIPRRMILTGTPSANSIIDIFAQAFILDDGSALGKTVTYFRSTYLQRGGWQGRQWTVVPGLEKEIINQLSPMVMRMKAEDYLSMPELVTQDILCTMPEAVRREYRRLKRDLLLKLESGEGIIAGSAAAVYGKMKQVCQGGIYRVDDTGGRSTHVLHKEKISALEDLCDQIGDSPALCYYSFKHDLERLQEQPRFKNAPAIRGGMNKKEVSNILDKWNAGEIPMLFCQPQSFSHGINAQGAGTDVIYFGIPDSPEVYDQSYRRVYRQGVKGSQVRIHRILMADSVELVQRDRLEGKFKDQEAFLSGLKEHAKT